MLRIVPHTVPRVGRSYEHFPDGFELRLLRRACIEEVVTVRVAAAVNPQPQPPTQVSPMPGGGHSDGGKGSMGGGHHVAVFPQTS